jgi:uncharacterized repeat protein (TIGR03803 family)
MFATTIATSAKSPSHSSTPIGNGKSACVNRSHKLLDHGQAETSSLKTRTGDLGLMTIGGAKDGGAPYAGVIIDRRRNLYGDTVFGGGFNDGTVYKLNTKGVIIVLHSFTRSDGTAPLGGVIRDAEGNLYGTTWLGGSSGASCGGYGCGTVWELTP